MAGSLTPPPASTDSSRCVAGSNDADILICGQCKTLFRSLDRLNDHKRLDCRATCACHGSGKHLLAEQHQHLCSQCTRLALASASLACATCGDTFDCAWSLCKHVQLQHSLEIFTEIREQTLDVKVLRNENPWKKNLQQFSFT